MVVANVGGVHETVNSALSPSSSVSSMWYNAVLSEVEVHRAAVLNCVVAPIAQTLVG